MLLLQVVLTWVKTSTTRRATMRAGWWNNRGLIESLVPGLRVRTTRGVCLEHSVQERQETFHEIWERLGVCGQFRNVLWG